MFYAVLVGLRTLDQHRINRLQVRRTDEQNDIRPTSFVNVESKTLPTKCPMLAQPMISICAVAIVKGENQKNNNCDLQNHRVLKGNGLVTDNPVGEY